MTLNEKRKKRYRNKRLKLLQCSCIVCNKNFEAKRVGMKYCSKECRVNGQNLLPKNRVKRNRAKSAIKIIYCKRCGIRIESIYHNVKYCIKCKEKIKWEKEDKRIGKRRLLKRPEEGAYCKQCGIFIGQVHLNTRFCKRCSIDIDKKNKAKWQDKKYIKIYPKEQICKICGKSFEATCAKNKCCSKECSEKNKLISIVIWRKKNKEHYMLLDHKRRERVKQAGSFSQIAKEYKERVNNIGECIYCGSKENITIDHLIPLSKGGKNEISNLFPACHKCNVTKNAQNWILWYKKQAFYSEDRENKILKMSI